MWNWKHGKGFTAVNWQTHKWKTLVRKKTAEQKNYRSNVDAIGVYPLHKFSTKGVLPLSFINVNFGQDSWPQHQFIFALLAVFVNCTSLSLFVLLFDAVFRIISCVIFFFSVNSPLVLFPKRLRASLCVVSSQNS